LRDRPDHLLLTDLERPIGFLAARACWELGRAYNVALPYIGMTGWLPKRAGKPTFHRGDLKSDPWAVDCFDESVQTALVDEEWVPKEDWAWDAPGFMLWRDGILDANVVHLTTYGSQYSDSKMAVGRRWIRNASNRLYQLNEDGTVEVEVLRGSF